MLPCERVHRPFNRCWWRLLGPFEASKRLKMCPCDTLVLEEERLCAFQQVGARKGLRALSDTLPAQPSVLVDCAKAFLGVYAQKGAKT